MINSLTSLRFFFAFFVFLSHLGFIKSDNEFFNWFQRNIFFEGYLGVSFFFILSGFVLSYSSFKYINNTTLDLNKKNFYLARFFRIYPLHLLTLLLSTILLITSGEFNIVKFIPNLLLIQSFIPNINFYYSFNSVSWSISNEMFFYFMFPFLLMTYLKYKRWLVFCMVLFLLILFIEYNSFSSLEKKFIYYINPISRLMDFIIGIFLFFLYKKVATLKIRKQEGTIMEISAILVFLCFFSIHNGIDRAFRYSIYYWIPMSLIILTFSLQKGYLAKLLQNKILVYLGEISFSFYMTHLLIIKIYNKMELQQDVFYTPLILLLATIFISILIFELFEKPINKYLKEKYLK